MKKIIIKDLNGDQINWVQTDNPQAIIDECIASGVWGLPEEYTIEIIDITAEVEQERINAEALKYLADTDWMIIREVDAGIACPADVKLARAEARARIVRNV